VTRQPKRPQKIQRSTDGEPDRMAIPVFEMDVGLSLNNFMEGLPTRDSYRGGGVVGVGQVCLIVYVNIDGIEAIGKGNCELEDQVKNPHVNAFFVRFRFVLQNPSGGWYAIRYI
jgi:hypothetical protein